MAIDRQFSPDSDETPRVNPNPDGRNAFSYSGDRRVGAEPAEAERTQGRLQSENSLSDLESRQVLRDAEVAKSLNLNSNSKYVVGKGDSLWSIAAKRLKDDQGESSPQKVHQEVERLKQLNQPDFRSLRKNSNYLRDGWELKIYDAKVQPRNAAGANQEIQAQPAPKVIKSAPAIPAVDDRAELERKKEPTRSLAFTPERIVPAREGDFSVNRAAKGDRQTVTVNSGQNVAKVEGPSVVVAPLAAETIREGQSEVVKPLTAAADHKTVVLPQAKPEELEKVDPVTGTLSQVLPELKTPEALPEVKLPGATVVGPTDQSIITTAEVRQSALPATPVDELDPKTGSVPPAAKVDRPAVPAPDVLSGEPAKIAAADKVTPAEDKVIDPAAEVIARPVLRDQNPQDDWGKDVQTPRFLNVPGMAQFPLSGVNVDQSFPYQNPSLGTITPYFMSATNQLGWPQRVEPTPHYEDSEHTDMPEPDTVYQNWPFKFLPNALVPTPKSSTHCFDFRMQPVTDKAILAQVPNATYIGECGAIRTLINKKPEIVEDQKFWLPEPAAKAFIAAQDRLRAEGKDLKLVDMNSAGRMWEQQEAIRRAHSAVVFAHGKSAHQGPGAIDIHQQNYEDKRSEKILKEEGFNHGNANGTCIGGDPAHHTFVGKGNAIDGCTPPRRSRGRGRGHHGRRGRH